MTVDVYRIFFSISGIQDVYNLYELIHDLGKVNGIPMASRGFRSSRFPLETFLGISHEMSMIFMDVPFFSSKGWLIKIEGFVYRPLIFHR